VFFNVRALKEQGTVISALSTLGKTMPLPDYFDLIDRVLDGSSTENVEKAM